MKIFKNVPKLSLKVFLNLFKLCKYCILYKMAHLTGVEPIAFWSVVRRSIQLSYRCIFTSNSVSELLPLLEAGASWEVSAFVSQIYLPSSSGSSYPDVFSVIHFAININQKCNLSPIYRKPTTSYYLFVKKKWRRRRDLNPRSKF